MDLQEIQNKLNTLLAVTERKIAFWYDDDAAYIDDIANLELAERNKISLCRQVQNQLFDAL